MLHTNLERFRAIRGQTLSMVQGLSQAQLDFAPAPSTWSVGEVVDHLILSVEIIRRDVAELIEITKAGKSPLLYRSAAEFNITAFFIPKCMLPFLEVPFNFLNMFVPDSIREFFVRYRLIPARAADTATPRPDRFAVELRDGLRLSLEELEALFAANPNLDYDTMMHQHPLLGTQNVPHLLYIMGLHEERHQAQISDLLADSRFPMGGPDIQNPRLSSASTGTGEATSARG
ncbi:MAG TPA: DinB family protein [Terriglobales bacterium]|nr:DinB family protein [Terriglobales bacterium]